MKQVVQITAIICYAITFRLHASETLHLSQNAHITASTYAAGGQFGKSIAHYSGTLVASAPGVQLRKVFVFDVDQSGNLSEHSVLDAPNGAGLFGHAVAVQGNFVFVSAPGTDKHRGIVLVYAKIADRWVQVDTITSPNMTSGDNFGVSLASHDKWLIVGTYGIPNILDKQTYSRSGQAYVYRLENGKWTYKQTLIPPAFHTEQYFGFAVAVHQNTAVVGAPLDKLSTLASDPLAPGTGASYVYVADTVTGEWKMTQELRSTNSADAFGYSVSIAEDIIAVGARYGDQPSLNGGTTFLYTRQSTGIWNQTAALQPENAKSGDMFGFTTLLSDKNMLIVSAPREDTQTVDAGAVYVFRNDNETWKQTRRILPPTDNTDGMWLGTGLAQQNKTLYISALFADVNDVDSGAVFTVSLSN